MRGSFWRRWKRAMIDLNPGQLSTVKAILAEHVPECEVRAFGSRAKWTAKDYSDLDLAVIGEGPLDWRTLDRLKEAFEESDLPMRVDVLDWHGISDSFRGVIEPEHVVLVTKAYSEGTCGSNEWKDLRLGEVLTLQRGFDLPKSKRMPGPYPVIASTGPVGTHNTAAVRGPGVVIGRSGSLGGGQFIGSDFWPLNTTLWVKDFQGNDIRFCYFLLKSLNLAQFNAGSGVPTLNRNHIHPLLVKIPSVPTQRTIAHVLGTLDDKIELNRRMNETLEEMARALFKSWFVDFEPVRAKMEGRWRRGESLPGLPAELYDLFPGRLVGSEVGEVPEGWEVRGLDEIATFLNGLALQKYPATSDSTLPVIKIAQLRAGHTAGSDSAGTDIPSQYVIHDGDVLFSWSGSLELTLWAGGDGALNQHLFKVSSESYPQWIYYYWVREHLPEFRQIAADKTTTMGHIQRRHLKEALAVVPNSALLDSMSCPMQLLLDRSLTLRLGSRALAAQRVSLLSKLVSGEVRVSGDIAE